MRKRPLAYTSNGGRRSSTATHALSLPGEGARCFHLGNQTRLYNTNTVHTIVEREPAIMTDIRSVLSFSELKHEPEFFCDYLHRFKPTQIYDLVYLDFCAPLNFRTAWWIMQEMPFHLYEGASMVVTLNRHGRNSHYMMLVKDILDEAPLSYQYEMINMVAQCPRVGNTNLNLRFIDDSDESPNPLPLGVWSARSKQHFKYHNQTVPVFHQSSIDSLIALKILLNNISFDLDFLIEYQSKPGNRNGSSHMVTIGLSNMGIGSYVNENPPAVMKKLAGFYKGMSRRQLMRRG